MSRRSGPTPTLLTVLLVTAFSLVAMLAVQSWATSLYHRQVTEDVLRDYAALAADEALRRIAVEIGYYGYGPALDLLRAQLSDTDAKRPWFEELAVPQLSNEEQRRALRLIDAPFVVDFERKPRSQTPDSPLAELQQSLGEINQNELAAHARTVEGPGGPASFVVSPVELGSRELVGFRVADDALEDSLTTALERRPLLPSSLGEGDLDNSVLHLSVTNRLEQALYATDSRYEAALVVERRPPPDYVSVIDGLVVRAAIDPGAAHRLVIGGLPRSRLPLLIGLLLLTSGLLAASVALLSRERALARMRTDFVSRVSHELRTPLAQIRMFSETLKLGRVRSDDERRRYLDILERESRRLSALVENVLQFSRAERDLLELHPENTALAPLVERLVDEVGPSLELEDTKFIVDIDPRLRAMVDRDALHQALLNLLDNAVKYGGGGPVRVVAETVGKSVRVAVEDQGPGIESSQRDTVWRPFERSNGTGHTGTGIGLAVVKEIVQQHGGRCWIEPNEPRGARVVLELPGAEAEP